MFHEPVGTCEADVVDEDTVRRSGEGGMKGEQAAGEEAR